MKFDTVKQLNDVLNYYNVPVHTFGTGNAKTIDDLFKEIQTGETVLLRDPDAGVLLRYFRATMVHVYHGHYKLHEDRQEFKDGRVRRRGFDFLAEKLPTGETAYDAAHRCLEEEINVSNVTPIFFKSEIMPHADSMSYPGILTIGDLTHFIVELDDSDYDSDGYIEEQESKINYYVWRLDRERVKPPLRYIESYPALEDDRGKNRQFKNMEV